MRRAGLKVADNALIMANVNFLYGAIEIGQGAFINVGCLIDGTGGVRIMEGVHLGPGVYLVTSTHEIGVRECRAGSERSVAVTVEAGAWLGARTTILPGVTIGAGAIIGAGSLVNANVETDILAAGVPASRKKPLMPEFAG